MAGELSGQVAIVTGGASRMGAASARLLEAAGATVIVADLQAGPKDAAAGRFVPHDVTSEKSWQGLLADVLGREGRLDVMVNNAGLSGSPGNPETTTVENWRQAQAVNSEGVFLGCKYALQGMSRTGPGKPASGGSIVNVSSVAGLIGSAGPTAYTAGEGAARLLSKSVALYCVEQKNGIRCNSVHPGGRIAEPVDLAELILWLASDRARWVTGAEFVADGGFTAGLQGRPLLAAP